MAEAKKPNMVDVLKGAKAEVLKKTTTVKSDPLARMKVQSAIAKGDAKLKKTTVVQNDPLARMKLKSDIVKREMKLKKTPKPEVSNISDRNKLLGQIKKGEVELEDTHDELANAENRTEWATKAAYKKEKKAEAKK
eukprot:CAMPEP_0170174118 /NCGR_PEP_ID=MMETSP0040_2-20121228/7367_1 /TAXON_ID=641309 /ORGANISM="Lotharella oceanica, Strain CCMP622" /LENGTH=135 /DNA_ID=CAMNT_0010415617 /DNA_START=65 /DNA_END=472 /DNA_ORIENTATION=+